MARNIEAKPGEQAPKPRIVQYNNRRYSIRLEPVFWRALETLAERNQMRLGKFIAELEETYQGKNFSSFLRVFSMLRRPPGRRTGIPSRSRRSLPHAGRHPIS